MGMGRALRIEFPGAIYHITSRGNSQQEIFQDSSDYSLLLEYLGETVRRYRWIIYAYCLMPNHYHLLLETRDANLSKGMRYLNSSYCQAFNRRHGRTGHVLQGRFHAILVEKETYLLEVIRYVLLNPVRAGLVTSPDKWKWSSLKATLDKGPFATALGTATVLDYFGSDRARARKAFMTFLQDGVGSMSPMLEVRNELILGSVKFVKKLSPLFRKVTKRRYSKRFPKIQRFATRPSLTEVLEVSPRPDVDPEKIKAAIEEHGYTIKEIAYHLGITPSKVARLLRHLRSR